MATARLLCEYATHYLKKKMATGCLLCEYATRITE